jgi:hypothetical protein
VLGTQLLERQELRFRHPDVGDVSTFSDCGASLAAASLGSAASIIHGGRSVHFVGFFSPASLTISLGVAVHFLGAGRGVKPNDLAAELKQ